MINGKKSEWEPTQILTWLGITINTRLQQLVIREKRITSLKNYITYLLSRIYTTARKLAKFVGMVISMQFVIGNTVRLMTRFNYGVIKSCRTWDEKLNITHYPKALEEILFWRNQIDTLNSKHFNVH